MADAISDDGSPAKGENHGPIYLQRVRDEVCHFFFFFAIILCFLFSHVLFQLLFQAMTYNENIVHNLNAESSGGSRLRV